MNDTREVEHREERAAAEETAPDADLVDLGVASKETKGGFGGFLYDGFGGRYSP